LVPIERVVKRLPGEGPVWEPLIDPYSTIFGFPTV
jgi:hypothetical protein